MIPIIDMVSSTLLIIIAAELALIYIRVGQVGEKKEDK